MKRLTLSLFVLLLSCTGTEDLKPIDLALSTNSLSMKVGETLNVGITAGSGSYTVNCDNPSVTTAVLNNTTITLKAVAVGTAIVTVTDTQTSQTEAVEVEVEEDLTLDRVTMEQYEAAKAYIQAEGLYRIFTQYNGTNNDSKKYYLKEDGSLTDNGFEARTFTFNYVTGTDLFISPGWKLDVPFTNPDLSNGATGVLNPQGYIHTNWTLNRNDWEGQVWYKNGNYYAVRSTNAVREEWGANTFWTVLDTNADGLPEADYSLRPQFIWQLEKSDEAVKVHLCPDTHHPHSIDLGIGVKWACCNVGATHPWEWGRYYAWGETTEKSEYNWGTYSYWNNKNNDGKIDADEITLGMNISGTLNDAARVNWGAPWRMPTRDEMYQFMNNCSARKIDIVTEGVMFIGSNGNRIFLPITGGRWTYPVIDARDRWGYFWTGTRRPDIQCGAYLFWCHDDIDYGESMFMDLCLGFPVRPVAE